jgi:hypothetical protein
MYILKLHHVENKKYSIIHLPSPTSTSLNSLKSRKKVQLFLKTLLECILDMWLINIRIVFILIIKFLKNSTFNTLKLVYGYLYFFGDKDKKLSTLPCQYPII